MADEDFIPYKPKGDEDWQPYVPPEEPSLLSKLGSSALGVIQPVLKTVDSYGGAPVRAAVGALQSGNNPLSAYKNQFGQDPETAPTGQQLAQKAGVGNTALSDVIPSLYSDTGAGMSLKKGGWFDPTASGVAGFGLNVATDPLTYFPVGKIAEGIGEGLSALKPAMLKGSARVAEALTGVPKTEVATYMKDIPGINTMGAKYGGEAVPAANDVRQGFQNSIQAKRQALNGIISKTLENGGKDATVDVAPALRKLEIEKARLNPNLYPEEIAQIDKISDRVKAAAGDTYMTDPRTAYDTQKFLQESGKAAYGQSGDIFQVGPKAARAAKNAGGVLRESVNDAVPEIEGANNQLAQLHNVEDNINSRVIAPGKTPASLMSVGSGTNPQDAQYLQKLQNLTGAPMMEDAQRLAAMRRFSKPDLLPVDTTGKSFTRMAIGGLLGNIVGRATHIPFGTEIGAMATSPAALKAGINTAHMVGDIASKAAPAITAGAKPAYMGLEQLNREEYKPSTMPFQQRSSQIIQKLQSQGQTQYAQQLQEAASKGPLDFAAKYYSMSQTYPNFRKMLEGSDSSSQ